MNYSPETLDFVEKIISAYPPQTAEEEIAMCEEYASSPQRLHDLLVLHNISYMMKVVGGYNIRGEDGDDFFALGLIGLVKAAKTFIPAKGNRFTTYAHFQILNALRQTVSEAYISVIANRMTSAIYDAPCFVDNPEGESVGDYLAYNLADSDWQRPDPSSQVRKQQTDNECNEVAEFVCNTCLPKETTPEMRRICQMLLTGAAERVVQERLGATRSQVVNAKKTYFPKIASYIDNADDKSEIKFFLAKHHISLRLKINPQKACQFISSKNVQVVRQVETEDDRISSLLSDFDSAVEWESDLLGRFSGGADYKAMRLVYERHARGDNILAICKRFKMPKAYALYLRESSIILVKKYLSKGSIPKKNDDISLLSKEDNAASASNLCTKIVSKRKRKDNKDDLTTTFGLFEGGFYSQKTYNRLRFGVAGERQLSHRQIEMYLRLNPDLTEIKSV